MQITQKNNSTQLTIANNLLPWNGKVKQISDAEPQQYKEEELVSFFVVCTEESMEPGREYSVLAVQDGNELTDVSYQTSN